MIQRLRWGPGTGRKWFIEKWPRFDDNEDTDPYPWRVLWPWDKYNIPSADGKTSVWTETRYRTGAEAIAAFNAGQLLDIERNLEGVVTCQNL